MTATAIESNVFQGCIPALMTPCGADGAPDFDLLVDKAQRLVGRGMTGVVYCGSMGEWPLLSAAERQHGVSALVEAGVPVVVGTGAASPTEAAAYAAHARTVGARGLMVIPRVLSRGTSHAAQRNHFASVLVAAGDLPAVIYNSPYYGFETRADLFFDLRERFPNLVGYKEFGGADALTYAAEHITSSSDDLALLVGVDTQVVHGIVDCGAAGWITGIGNILTDESLTLSRLATRAAQGDSKAGRLALELEAALLPLARLDAGPDLVPYFKHLAVLRGDDAYAHSLLQDDRLAPAQANYATAQLRRFEHWWSSWEGADYASETVP